MDTARSPRLVVGLPGRWRDHRAHERRVGICTARKSDTPTPLDERVEGTAAEAAKPKVAPAIHQPHS